MTCRPNICPQRPWCSSQCTGPSRKPGKGRTTGSKYGPKHERAKPVAIARPGGSAKTASGRSIHADALICDNRDRHPHANTHWAALRRGAWPGRIRTIASLRREWQWLVTCGFFTAGGEKFYASLMMLALCVGTAELIHRTRRTIVLFWSARRRSRRCSMVKNPSQVLVPSISPARSLRAGSSPTCQLVDVSANRR